MNGLFKEVLNVGDLLLFKPHKFATDVPFDILVRRAKQFEFTRRCGTPVLFKMQSAFALFWVVRDEFDNRVACNPHVQSDLDGITGRFLNKEGRNGFDESTS